MCLKRGARFVFVACILHSFCSHYSILEQQEISNNMLSYLTNLQRQEESSDILSTSLNVLGTSTIFHLTGTYFVIKFILSRKYSKSIRTAEEYNQVSKFSVLGFRKLILYLALLWVCIMAKFINHQGKFFDVKRTSSPPPVTVVSTLMAAVTCLYFVFSKQKIREFIMRRANGYFESYFPSIILKRHRKIVPTLNND